MPFAEVSASEHVPVKTLYNWREAGRLKSRTENGVAVVDPVAVRALVAARNAARGGASAGNTAGNGNPTASGTAHTPDPDGALAAKVFEAFDQGTSPADLVQAERLVPATVMKLWREWKEMKEAGGGDRKTLAQRVEDLERATQAIARTLAEGAWGLGTAWVATDAPPTAGDQGYVEAFVYADPEK
jgi:hypothetical protein